MHICVIYACGCRATMFYEDVHHYVSPIERRDDVPRGSPPFLHKLILHTLDPTQPIQHTIVPSRAYYATSVVLHEAVIYDTCNRSNTWRFCTCFDTARGDTAQPPIHHKPISHVPDSTQPVSTHRFFSTKLVLHHRSPILRTNISQVGKVGRRYGLPTCFLSQLKKMTSKTTSFRTSKRTYEKT